MSFDGSSWDEHPHVSVESVGLHIGSGDRKLFPFIRGSHVKKIENQLVSLGHYGSKETPTSFCLESFCSHPVFQSLGLPFSVQ
jgi:hypothetical protein